MNTLTRTFGGFSRVLLVGGVIVGIAFGSRAFSQPARSFQVKIEDEKTEIIEPVLPVDPVRRINYSASGNMGVTVRNEQNQTMHLGTIFTLFNIDGQVIQAGQGGRMEIANARLPKTAGGQERDGFYSVYVHNDLRITQTVEVVPTRPQAAGTSKRRRDAVLVRYGVDNKGSQVRKVGVRIFLDVYIVDNDGALFAAPTIPDKVLNGVELKDKTLPDYLQVLQRPDLKAPGFVAHFTYALGKTIERPSRVVLTALGAGGDNWNVNVQQAMGDSAMAVFWDPQEIKPNSKRDMGYAYGQGIAYPVSQEGQMQVVLGGSFEPGKIFTLAAHVNDPAPGQSLTLELPPGMQRLEGKSIQPVPAVNENGNSLVLWKARVLNPGRFTLRVRSSTGVTQTKVVTITKGTSE